jgi:hypothetical protein
LLANPNSASPAKTTTATEQNVRATTEIALVMNNCFSPSSPRAMTAVVTRCRIDSRRTDVLPLTSYLGYFPELKTVESSFCGPQGRSERDATFWSSHVIPIIQIVPPQERATPYGIYRKLHPVQVKRPEAFPPKKMPPTLKHTMFLR